MKHNIQITIDEILEEACANGNTAEVISIEQKHNYDLKSNKYILYCAVFSKNQYLVKYLISKGCTVDPMYDVIADCIWQNNESMLKLLIESGFSPDESNWEQSVRMNRSFQDYIWDNIKVKPQYEEESYDYEVFADKLYEFNSYKRG